MIFTGTFNTYDNEYTYSVTIGNSGTTINIVDPTEDIWGENKPSVTVMFAPDPVYISTDRTDLTKRIIISQATINLISDSNLTSYLFANTNRTLPVRITQDSDNCFFGYVDPLQFDQGYAHNYENIQVTATDPLGALEERKIGNVEGLSANMSITSWDLIETILNDIDIYDIDSGSIDVNVINALYDTNIQLGNFFGDSEDDWMSLYDVLTEICKYWNLYISYYDETANITCTINDTPTHYTITNFKNYAADDSTSLSVDDVYSQVTLTCDIDPVEDPVISFDDDDYLYSDYSNYDRYMTELISPGEGKSAYNGFYDLLTSPTGASNYEEAYTIDNFVYVKRNNLWNFGPQSYITYMGGSEPTGTQGGTAMTGEQRNVLTWLKNNSGKGAIIAFGRSNKLNKKDNSPVANISMTNYLVISVNGLFNNTDAGGSAMETMLQAANPVCSFNGLTSAILSPTDPRVTNYIVISGKMILNPLQKLTGPHWNNDADTLRNTVQECIDDYTYAGASKITNGHWHHTVPHPDNDDGAYYQQVWDLGTNGLYGYLDNSKNRSLEYEYSAVEDETDRLSKLPVLACELKVGDKYCVERFDLGEEGVGKFEWLTLAQCTALGISPEFTIGIDPKIDDMIIGQTFSIQNNVNYKMHLDKTGTAIPIKTSDNLVGDISFKILGPYNLSWNKVSKETHRRWLFWKKTIWNNDLYHVLQYIQSIMVSNLKIEMTSDNGYISDDKISDDKDLIYASNTNPAYVTKLEENVKICTPLTLDECNTYQIKYQISNSYIYNTDDTPFYGFQSGANTVKPEACYIDYMYNEYSTPAKMITTSLFNNAFANGMNGTSINEIMMEGYVTGIYPQDNGAYRIMSYTSALKNRTLEMTLRQHKTYNHTQI